MNILLTQAETHRLLDALIVELGFSFAPEFYDQMSFSPPDELEEWLDVLLLAEELEPDEVGRSLRRAIRDRVVAAHHRSAQALENHSF